jgi:glucosamine 6-phosphate synthetase-like amidotransferase/phosphosugar isomerase protein
MTFKPPKDTSAVIGHTRHSTQGSCKKRYNNHPFRGRLKDGCVFALAHNGVIVNDHELRKAHGLPETKIETDSYIAVQLLERDTALSFESIKEMVQKLHGSFSFALLDDRNSTWLVRGDNPLSILHFKALGLYTYASTDQLLWRALSSSLLAELKAGQYEEIRINEGQILRISPDGNLSWGEFEFISDYGMTGMYNWWEYGCMRRHVESDETAAYVAELKSVAGGLGYTSDDIDSMLHYGYTLDEIEELLYGCDKAYYLVACED